METPGVSSKFHRKARSINFYKNQTPEKLIYYNQNFKGNGPKISFAKKPI